VLELYVANKNYSSWSLRPWVLLRELGIPFTERLRPFEGPRSPGFRQFSPSGKVPALHDDDLRVWDSLAIVEHLAESHPNVWPADRAARAWARSAAAEMHSGFTALRSQCSMNVGIRVRLHAVSPALREDLDRIDALWSEGLARWGGPLLTGSAFTAVDAFFAPVAFRIQTYGLPLGPAALAYAARLRELPSMREWERDALAETWREEGHDAEIAASGTLVEDLRATG
jgi:glutathione S-transferase